MKHFIWLGPAIAVLAVGLQSIAESKPQAAQQQEKKEEKPPVVTLQGQVIDFACYFSMSALGGEHQQCAEMCVKGGATTGFKTKDKTYVVIRDPMHQKDAPDLLPFVNKDAEVSANVFTRDGVAGVKILSIKAK